MTPANEISIAYFSMDIAADPRLPTYIGGLGVLAAHASLRGGCRASDGGCLYDRHIPEWRHDNLYLSYALGIGVDEILRAQLQAKRELLREIKQATGVQLSENVATLGFARRAAEYKCSDLLFSDLNRLRALQKNAGPFQVVFGGKAHPRDESGKAEIRKVFEAAAALRDSARGRLAQYAASTIRSVRHEWHEGGYEWRPKSQRAGWLVGRRALRGCHGLVYRLR